MALSVPYNTGHVRAFYYSVKKYSQGNELVCGYKGKLVSFTSYDFLEVLGIEDKGDEIDPQNHSSNY